MIFVFALLLLAGTVHAASPDSEHRTFQFPADTLAFANELTWEYALETGHGHPVTHRRVPKPSYTLHCFAVARTARQFFDQARFDPSEPKATPATYRYLVHTILACGRNRPCLKPEKFVIPGYADLREFSDENETLLKAEMGGAWQSFLQHGNWRMIFPFSRRHQERTANDLRRALEDGRPPLVHLVCFPKLTLNHFILLFAYRKTRQGFEFDAYDPNQPLTPVPFFFDASLRRFRLSHTPYFLGGRVKAYQAYCGVVY